MATEMLQPAATCRAGPEPENLASLASGTLADPQASRLHRHCLLCDSCGAQLEALLLLRHARGLRVPAMLRRQPLLAAGSVQ